MSPTERLCAEESREARKHPTKKKAARFGRFGGKIWNGGTRCEVRQLSGISMGRKLSRRKSRGRKRPSTRFTAAGNPDRTRVFGILEAKKYRRRKRGLVPVYGATDPRKCRV